MSDAQIKITADTSSAQKDIDKLNRSLGDINKTGISAGKALAGLTAAAAAVGYTVLKTLESAGQLIDAANALGIAAQSLQVMQHAAAQSGVSADELNSSLMRLNNNIGTALIQGTGGATDALKKLGIPLDQIARLKTDEQFKVLATEINKIPNAAERSAIAMDLFGKQGPKMLALADNIAKVDEKLTKMGLKLTDLDVAALDKAGDAVDELVSLFGSALKKAVVDIAPYIVAIVEAIKDAIIAAGGFENIWGAIKTAVKTVIDIMLVMAAIKLAQGAIALYRSMVLAGEAAALFNTIVKRNPLMLAVGAALALANILGLNVTGALWEMAGLSDRVDEAQKNIAKDAEEIAKKNAEQVELTKGLNKEQEKLLESLNKTISALETTAKQKADSLTMGETEAKIAKTIADENAKLLEQKIQMSAEDENRIRAALMEEASAERLLKLRQAQQDVRDQWQVQGGQSSEVIAVEKNITEAKKSLQEAQTETTKREAQRQLDFWNWQFEEVSLRYAESLNSRTALDREYADNKAKVAMAMTNLAIAGYNTETEEYKAMLEQKALLDLEYNDKKIQADADRIAKTKLLEADARAVTFTEDEKATLQKARQQDLEKQYLQSRIDFEKKSTEEKTAFVIDQGAQMFTALGAHNKKAFEVAKAFNIANAIMNTYMAATKALASFPPPFNFVAMGAAVAMGMAQVAQIRSQQYSGRALGGPVMGNQSYIVGENGPELFTPNTTGSITRNDQLGGGGSSVNFTIQANDAAGFDQLLLERKGMIQQMISDAMLERGQRSKM